MTEVISKEEQLELLRYVKAFAEADVHVRHAMVLAMTYTLKEAAPPHWVINLSCGRTDRLFEEINENDNS